MMGGGGGTIRSFFLVILFLIFLSRNGPSCNDENDGTNEGYGRNEWNEW